MEAGRSYRIDALKSIAIIAVVLYHFGGYLTYGYLGVDIFFVVSGYFMMKSIAKAMQENRFSYWRFIVSRVARLWQDKLIKLQKYYKRKGFRSQGSNFRLGGVAP